MSSLVLKKNRLISLEFLQRIDVVCNQQVFSLVSKPKYSDSAKLSSHPDVMEPDVMEPDVMEPDVMEPDVMKPDVMEPVPSHLVPCKR